MTHRTVGHRLRIALADRTTVEVDGTSVPDPDPAPPPAERDGRLLVVTVRMPGHLAHSLAHLLATWNALTTLMASDLALAWDWTDHLTAPHHAAGACHPGCTLSPTFPAG